MVGMAGSVALTMIERSTRNFQALTGIFAGLALFATACADPSRRPVTPAEARPDGGIEASGEFEFAADWSAASVRKMAESEDSPGEVLDWLASDPDRFVRSRVAANRNTSETLLAILAEDRDTGVRHAAMVNFATPAAAVAGAVDDWRWEVAREAARRVAARGVGVPVGAERQCDRSDDPERIALEAQDRDIRVRLCAARNRSAPASVLEALSTDAQQRVRAAVAAHEHTPARTLGRLAEDPVLAVRLGVAGNPSASRRALASLSADPSSIVRARAASHRALPSSLLEKLARDSHVATRMAVAMNPASPGFLSVDLAGDADAWVKRALLGNGWAPPAALDALERDETVSRITLVRHPSTPDATRQRALATLLQSDESWDWSFVASREDARPELRDRAFSKLAGVEDASVRQQVARNSRAPASLLEKLAGDHNPNVRYGVVRNRSTPETVLKRLISDPDERVRKAAEYRLNSDP